MAEHYLVHRETGKRFDLLRVDRKTGMMTLRGSRGGEFEERYEPEGLKKRGYQLRKVEEDDAEQQGVR